MTTTSVDLTVQPAPAAVPARPRRARVLYFVAEHAIAIGVAIAFLMPFVFITLTAFMSDQQALTSIIWPREWHPENFGKVFTEAPFLTWLRNSLMYSVLATAFMLLSSIPAAYALARLQWRGRNLAMFLVITMMMLPPQVTIVPLYDMWARADLTGTLWPLIIPMLFGNPFSIFLLRQFFVTIPQEYSDAARVDGCSELTVLLRVILPMAKPAIVATAMFHFFYTWNDYFGPVLYTSENEANWPVAIGLASFRSLHHVQWNLVMAATVLVMIPVLVLFFLAQKAFVQGVTLTGVKG
jgi:multiple sugar transport system permease protein